MKAMTPIQTPLFQLVGFGHAEKTSFSFLRKKVSPLPLNGETQTSGQKVADSGGNSVKLIKA